MSKVELNLKNELKNFGLNPRQWCLHKLARRKFIISHVEDGNFYFLGETKSRCQRHQWAKLQLISY